MMNCKRVSILIFSVDRGITQVRDGDLRKAREALMELSNVLNAPAIAVLADNIDYLNDERKMIEWLKTWQAIKRALQAICAPDTLLIPRNDLLRLIEELARKAQ